MTGGRGASPVDSYLRELAAALPRGRAGRDLIDEAREHLREASAAGEAAGLTRDDAERAAVRQFGQPAELAPQFRAAAVLCDLRQQAWRQLIGALLLLACIPVVGHLLPGIATWLGSSAPRLTASHAAIGAALGSSLLLLGASRLPWAWRDARWLTRLESTRVAMGWLFHLGMMGGTTLLAFPIVQRLDIPLPWLVAGGLSGHLIAGLLVPLRSHGNLPTA